MRNAFPVPFTNVICRFLALVFNRSTYNYVWAMLKHIEFATILAPFFSSGSNYVVRFLPEFSFNILQTLSQ